ncbi:hypothetical protein BH10ACT2_BH10ACT2_13520 [soil metagenome]
MKRLMQTFTSGRRGRLRFAVPLLVMTASVFVGQTAPAHADDGGMGEHTCDGCQPPLEYQGGRVMDTTGPDGVTITPIFWAPEGYEFPDGYQDLIVRYIEDIAADSGATSNVYSHLPEYSILEGEFAQDLEYKLTAGATINDTNAYPESGCEPADGFTDCITDAQLRDELTALAESEGLITDLANFYPVFFPPTVETMDLDGSNSIDGYCGYHRAFGEGDAEVVYGNEPFEPEGCGQPHAPNGDFEADGAISVLSHELMEAFTDPEDVVTWNDQTGHEIGDICAEFYGPPLGYGDATDTETSGYNQVINGNVYFTQTEFSNAAFAAFGEGSGCQQSADAGATATTSPIGVMLGTANPNVLDADGTSVADIETIVIDPDGNAIADDNLSFSTKVIDGEGECGELSETRLATDESGFATLTYTASLDDVVCGIVITDAIGGQAATAAIYQGSYSALAPTAVAEFPATFTAGGDATTFDVTFTNPGSTDFVSAQVAFVIFPADDATDDVTADQVTVSVSTDGPDGEFAPLEMSGATVSEGSIEGDIENLSVPANSTITLTFEVAIDDSVPTSTEPLLQFEAFLDIINPATGAGTNLADTFASDVSVVDTTDSGTTGSGTASDSSDSSTWLIVAVVVVVLVAAAATVVVVRRRRKAAAPQ